ncbi:MAG: hypothetical protein M1816_001563 [Peltula sp. TS41687]|nr:MAG: hypothetical protein M1816_001563 [Peltula sp. TS41687]
MPYNTRRKSLSLPSLGIQLPRTSGANRSSQVTTSATNAEAPPSKRVKRSHSIQSATSPIVNTNTKPARRTAVAPEPTPPPSPYDSFEPKIDIDGIGDDIVVGVIQQLEKTGNKPQLVKELAAVLCNTLDVVESSANPQAIISSRLNSYLKRPWTALAPCPLAKTLIPTHPRRIYYYLTNQPHQPLPAFSSESPLPSNRRAIISPSLSSEEDQEARRRAALSPSPEVDLSIPELEELDLYEPPTPAGSFSGRSSLSRDGSHPDSEVMSRRAMSPPLEGDEREFTQTASAMQSKRSFSSEMMVDDPTEEIRNSIEGEKNQSPRIAAGGEHVDDQRARHREAAATLFGQSPAHGSSSSGSSTTMGIGSMILSSPIARPSTALQINTNLNFSSPSKRRTVMTGDGDMMDIDQQLSIPDINWGVAGVGATGELPSPENTELAELDDLLGGF